MAIGFKKREVSVDRVAAVESATSRCSHHRRHAHSLYRGHFYSPNATTCLGKCKSWLESQEHSTATLQYAVGKVFDVPVGLIRSNPFQSRGFVYTSTAVDAMAESLKASGPAHFGYGVC